MIGLSLLASPIVRKLAIGAAVIAALAAGYFWWRAEIRAEAQAHLVAEYERATEAEAGRRRAALDAAQETGRALAAELAEKDRTHASLVARLAAQSRANDNRACHDPVARDRIDSVRRPARADGRQAGH